MNTTILSGNMLDAKLHVSPFLGWQWLRIPGLLLVFLGVLGIFRVHAETVMSWLGFMNFPPLWSCWLMIGGGVFLLAISMAAYHARYRHALNLEKQKTWRSL